MKRFFPALGLFLCINLEAPVWAGNFNYDTLISSDIYQTIEWKNLLHYANNKSVIDRRSPFFLSDRGYKNPHAEYTETIKQLFNPNLKDNESIVCRYPSRVDFIMKNFGLTTKDILKQNCSDFREYQSKVPFDNVHIVFASENNTSPTSMMGHTFLKISGTGPNGHTEHAFSYFAALDNTSIIKFFYKILTTGMDGLYILSPYKTKQKEYLIDQRRSLWEFEIKLTDAEKNRLKNHLWELRGHKIKYSLIRHNCNTALVGILKVANPEFKDSTVKPFSTPLEYIQGLNNSEQIKNISIDASDSYQKVIDKYGLYNILSAPKPARVSIGYERAGKDFMRIEFSPAYQDGHDISNAYFDELESKIMAASARINLESGKFILDRLDLLQTRSITDILLTGSFSKHLKVSLENRLWDNSTRLRPTVEFGLGAGIHTKYAKFYILPRVGYRYQNVHNAYIVPEIGLTSRITDSLKLMLAYEYYFDFHRNNRGYRSALRTYLGYSFYKAQEVFISYEKYTDSSNGHAYRAGIALHF